MGFLNMSIEKRAFSKMILDSVSKQKDKYGSDHIKKTVCIDYSAPNIAKSFFNWALKIDDDW